MPFRAPLMSTTQLLVMSVFLLAKQFVDELDKRIDCTERTVTARHRLVVGQGDVAAQSLGDALLHPYDKMHHEDNDFYVRAGAIWSYLSAGNVIENNYYSFLFNTSEEDEKGNQKGYGPTMAGFMSDFIYSHAGLHCVLPEISGSGIDYDKDGYYTIPELERWASEEMGDKIYSPWKPYDHPVLGKVEVGGSRGIPRGLQQYCQKQ